MSLSLNKHPSYPLPLTAEVSELVDVLAYILLEPNGFKPNPAKERHTWLLGGRDDVSDLHEPPEKRRA